MDQAAEQMLPPAPSGRLFELRMRPGLADCAPSGRIRLDALARWLQEVAYADVEDAGLAQAAVWVVRRTRIRVTRFPRFGESHTVRTFASGLGRMWAERRTTITREDEAESSVEAVALWVHLDPVARRPTPLREEELAVYGALGHDRRVSARLRHPAPADVEGERGWTFRRTDLDVADHVNNAAYWQPLEEELLAAAEPAAIDVEIEFRTPAQPGHKKVLAAGPRLWILGEGDEAHASLLVRELNR